MSEYCHYVAGFFARREEVDSAFSNHRRHRGRHLLDVLKIR